MYGSEVTRLAKALASEEGPSSRPDSGERYDDDDAEALFEYESYSFNEAVQIILVFMTKLLMSSEEGATSTLKKLVTAASQAFGTGGKFRGGYVNPFADPSVKDFIKDAGKLREKISTGARGADSATPEQYTAALDAMLVTARELLNDNKTGLALVQLLTWQTMVIAFTLHCRGETVNSIEMLMVGFDADRSLGSMPYNACAKINLDGITKVERRDGGNDSRGGFAMRLTYPLYFQPGDLRFSAAHAFFALVVLGGRQLRTAILAARSYGPNSGSTRDGTLEEERAGKAGGGELPRAATRPRMEGGGAGGAGGAGGLDEDGAGGAGDADPAAGVGLPALVALRRTGGGVDPLMGLGAARLGAAEALKGAIGRGDVGRAEQRRVPACAPAAKAAARVGVDEGEGSASAAESDDDAGDREKLAAPKPTQWEAAAGGTAKARKARKRRWAVHWRPEEDAPLLRGALLRSDAPLTREGSGSATGKAYLVPAFTAQGVHNNSAKVRGGAPPCPPLRTRPRNTSPPPPASSRAHTRSLSSLPGAHHAVHVRLPQGRDQLGRRLERHDRVDHPEQQRRVGRGDRPLGQRRPHHCAVAKHNDPGGLRAHVDARRRGRDAQAGGPAAARAPQPRAVEWHARRLRVLQPQRALQAAPAKGRDDRRPLRGGGDCGLHRLWRAAARARRLARAHAPRPREVFPRQLRRGKGAREADAAPGARALGRGGGRGGCGRVRDVARAAAHAAGGHGARGRRAARRRGGGRRARARHFCLCW